MSKHGMSLLALKAKKMRTFFEKVDPWREQLSVDKKRAAYHCLLVFASEHIPLVHQDEVIEKAKDMYYELKPGRR